MLDNVVRMLDKKNVREVKAAGILKQSINIPMTMMNRRLLLPISFSVPTMLQLEPTNKCNLKCGMCHRNFMPLSRIGELDFDHFRKIVDPLFPCLERVWLQGLGEPFLCKDIFKIIRYLKGRNVFVNTVTNATLLNEDVCRKIISSGLDEISISIDGVTAETYERIRVGADFEDVVRNAQTLTSLISTAQNGPKVVVFVVAMKDNIHELPDLVTLVNKMGIKYLWVQDVQFQQLEAGLAKKEKSLRVLAEKQNEESTWIENYLKKALQLANNYGIELVTYGGKSIFDRLYISRKRQKCVWPWTSVYITWDGFVSPCCIPSTYFCGNLFNESFKKIWNNEKYRDFRIRLESGMLPYQCINCSFL
jgi:radical SAM protein with 4Fe4S-binding SPASM domain